MRYGLSLGKWTGPLRLCGYLNSDTISMSVLHFGLKPRADLKVKLLRRYHPGILEDVNHQPTKLKETRE